MVSKYLIGAALLFAGANAEHDLQEMAEKKLCFEPALFASEKGYGEVKEIEKGLKYEDAKAKYSCCKEHSFLWMFTDKADNQHIVCSKVEMKNADTFKIPDNFKLLGLELKEINNDSHHCDKAVHLHEDKFEKLLKKLQDGKKDAKEEVKEDTQTMCVVGTPKKEATKDEKKDEKKEGKNDEEKKVEYDWTYIIVEEKEKKVGEKMAEFEILGKKLVGFCGTKKAVDEEVAKYSKKDEAGCCQCPCYVWVIVAIGVVGVGVGTWYALKEDDVEEDEFADQYA